MRSFGDVVVVTINSEDIGQAKIEQNKTEKQQDTATVHSV